MLILHVIFFSQVLPRAWTLSKSSAPVRQEHIHGIHHRYLKAEQFRSLINRIPCQSPLATTKHPFHSKDSEFIQKFCLTSLAVWLVHAKNCGARCLLFKVYLHVKGSTSCQHKSSTMLKIAVQGKPRFAY